MEWFIDFVVNSRTQLTAFFIGYFPTLMFGLMLLGAIAAASIRGIRKTRISIIHSLIAFSICLIFFIALVDDKNVDAFILSVTNSIVGPNGMQRMFGVSEDCKTFREIFIEFIPKQMNFVDGLSLIIKDNGNYLSSLVDVAYRLTFGIVMYVLFWILKFILWIIYLIFYNERKYIKRREAKYEKGLVDTPYRKRRLLSAFVGCGRGIISGILVLSFLGMFFYIFAGGLGDGNKSEKIETNNPDVNYALDAYSELETYGTKGIYKILNSVRDEKNMPYYLFAANIIFKGRVEDSIGTTNVYLVDELASYVNFSKNVLNLFIKYDKENLTKLINNEGNVVLLDDIIRVMNDTNFQKEFDELIKSFESKTYFINLTYSLVDSLSSHLTDVSFTKDMPEEVLVPLRILFEEGYLCEEIPYEKKLANDKYINRNTPSYNESDYILGYIKPSNILEKGDIFNLYKIFERVFTNIYNTENEPVDNILNSISEAIPYIKELSILDTDRSYELDDVMKRIYAYLEIKYLGGESELVYKAETTYKDSAYASIRWVDELSMLVDVLDSGLNIYRTDFTDQTKILDSILNLFKPGNNDAEKVINALTSSRLIGELFGSKFFQEGYDNLITGLIDIASFPEDMSFGNIYDNDGHFVDYGEFYYLARGLKSMMQSADANAFINDIANNNIGNDPMAFLTKLSNIISTRVDDKTVGDYISDSRIINSILSAFLIKNSLFDNLVIYIDESVLETTASGEVLNIITKEELKTLYSNFPTFIEIATPLIQNQNMTAEQFQNELISIIKNEKVIDMLDSKIIEGTVSYLAANNISGTIIIPQSMKDGIDLVSVDNHVSEIKKLLTLINDKELNINIDDLIKDTIDEEQGKGLLETFTNASDQKLDEVLSSNILYYTISNFLNENGDRIAGAMQIIVPDIANEELVGDTLDKVIKKDILKDFVKNIRIIITTDSVESLEMLTRIIKHKEIMDNMIISVTTANLLANNLNDLGTLKDVLSIPVKYDSNHNGNIDKLKQEFSRTNPWFLEAKALINALDLVLDLKEDEILNPDHLADNIINQINTLNDKVNGTNETKLDKLYNSEIFVSTISKNISDSLTSNGVISVEQLENAKIYGTDNFKKSEIRSLVNVFTVFDLDVNDNNIGDVIAEDVEANFITYADRLEQYGDKSKLDLLYESVIVKELFTSNINSSLTTGELVDVNALELCYDNNRYYKQGEIESLIYLMKKLKITDISNIDPNTINENIGYITEDDVNYLYRYNATSILLCGALKSTGVIFIAQEAKVHKNGVYYEAVNSDEAESLVYVISELGLDINNINIEDIDLNNINIDKIKNSIIISSVFYTGMKEVDQIVIPKAVLSTSNEGNSYIKLDEFGKFLTSIFENKDVLFDGGYISLDGLDVDLENSDFTNDVIISLCSSKILSCTMAVEIVDVVNNIPDNYKNQGIKEEIETNIDNVWVKNNEMYRLALAYDAIGMKATDDPAQFASKFDPKELSGKYNGTDKTKFDTCYESNVVKYIISNEIYNGIPAGLLDDRIKEYSYIYNKEEKTYIKSEVKGILDVLDILDMNLEDLKIDGIDENTIKKQVKNDKMYDSYIIKGILTKKIHDSIEGSAISDCDLCFEDYIPVYKKNEITALFDLIGNSDISNFDTSTISINDVLDKIYDDSHQTESYVIVSTISKNIIASNVIIPKECYNSTNKIINPDELRYFIEGIQAFGITINGINVELGDNVSMPNANDNQLEIISNSMILRAELSKKVIINNDNITVENDSKYALNTKKIKNNPTDIESNIAIVSKEELKSIIKSINILTTGSTINDISITLEGIITAISDENNMNILLNCSAIRVLIGTLSDLPMIMVNTNIVLTKTILRVVNFGNANVHNANVYIKQQI